MTYYDQNAHKLADLKAMTLVELADIGAKPADVERILKMSAPDTRYTGHAGYLVRAHLSGTLIFLLNGGLSVMKWCRGFIRALQYGRMKSVLHKMPNDLLDEIGISRAEIPEYARSLVYEEDK